MWFCCSLDTPDFNPRSHEGSDSGHPVSGHNLPDFNPRSHEGSDSGNSIPFSFTYHFNPRSHEGSDDGSAADSGGASVISIHAPTRGATLTSMIFTSYASHFNPRSHEGSDTTSAVATTLHQRFQSTLPRGERLFLFKLFQCSSVFQSTLPRGERPVILDNL